MQIVQATFGVFHQFELARELLRRGHLKRIYSTFPWARLKREGISHALVETFPWIDLTQMVLAKRGLLTPEFGRALARHNGPAFDRWLTRRMPECEVLISLSGTALEAGKLVQGHGGRFVCDRGSTHRRFQSEIVEEEHRRWKLGFLPDDARDVAREETIYAQADAIVVPSQAARRSFLELGFAPEKVHAIPYGVLLDRFRPAGLPPSGVFEVLFVGGVSLRKGIPYLLEGFRRLRHPHKRLRIAGAVPNAMRGLIATLPLDGVEFLGAVPQAKIAALMSTSHVLVLPSVEEGLALVQGQALACGCPVIATDAAGAEDLFSDGVEGFIVPIRSPEMIAERLQMLVDDPGLRERMAAAGLARVCVLGGWRDYGDRWEEFLRGMVGAEVRGSGEQSGSLRDGPLIA